MPRLNVQKNNQNIIKAFQVALETGHRNLLDNPWFTVNQRNFTTSTGVNNFYSVDRWYIARGTGTISKTSNGITINGVGASRETTFQQMIDCGDLTGRTVTLSVNDGGTIRQMAGEVPARTASNNIFIRFTLRNGVSAFLYAMATSSAYAYMLQFQVNAGYTIDLRAVKLELGSYSTLANDVPPKKRSALADCQERFLRVKSDTTVGVVGFGSQTQSDRAYILIPTPVTMELNSNNTMSVSLTGTARLVGNGSGSITVTSVSFVSREANGVLIACFGSNIVANVTYNLYLTSGSHIDISGDL